VRTWGKLRASKRAERGIGLKRSIIVQVGIEGMVGEGSGTEVVGQIFQFLFDCFKAVANFFEEFEDGFRRKIRAILGHAPSRSCDLKSIAAKRFGGTRSLGRKGDVALARVV